MDARTTPINVAYPSAGELQLHVAAGACRFTAKPGEGDAWVAGTYYDPSGSRPARITQDGGTVRLSAGLDPIEDLTGLFSGVPRYDLTFGKARPFALVVETGASEFNLDLGGVPLTSLVLKQGAGKCDVDFSAPNPQRMALLNLGAGAGAMFLANLANANCDQMVVEGGAAAFRLDFGGRLQRDASVRVSTGVSSVEITIPAGTAAKVDSEKLLGGLDAGDGFTKRAGAFWTEAALAGGAPVLNIKASVALGSLQLRIR